MEERLYKAERLLDEHGRRLSDFEVDAIRTRERVSVLEADHASVRKLADTTLALGDRVNELADGVDAIAERAVEAVLERRHERRRASWKYWAGWTAAAASALGFLADHFHLHL